MHELDRFIAITEQLYEPTETPSLVARAKAVRRVLADETVEQVAEEAGFGRRFLRAWVDVTQKDGFYGWLDKAEPKPERIQRACGSIAQMFVGSLAEEHFLFVANEALRKHGFHATDDRVGRTDTDFRLVDANEHPVCRFNIKFHGTLFRESREYVDLEPEDCFALATYKIHGALNRQDQEFLPYVFSILSVPEFPRSLIEKSISDDFAWLSAIQADLLRNESPACSRGKSGRLGYEVRFVGQSFASSPRDGQINC